MLFITRIHEMVLCVNVFRFAKNSRGLISGNSYDSVPPTDWWAC